MTKTTVKLQGTRPAVVVGIPWGEVHYPMLIGLTQNCNYSGRTTPDQATNATTDKI